MNKMITQLLVMLNLLFWAAPQVCAHILDSVTLDNGEEVSYQQLLDNNKLAGLSVAVVDNYQLVYSHTAGLKEFGGGDKIDQDTAFSTASISKPVTATIAMMLVEQGKLELDEPINRYLKRWHLPDFPLAKNRPVTLRDLLSHTAGTTQGGFADFYQGDDIPTPIESLNGIKLPRYHQPIAVTFKPGSDWNYSGGGDVIVQIALEDITHKPLAQLAEEMIFKPLNMIHTTMHQPGDKLFLDNVAKVHDDKQQVIGTGLPICPQIAPSGMWSTAKDMTKLMIEFQLALKGDKSTVISPWVAQQTTHIQTLKKVGGWGLGWMRAEANGNLDWFSHGGSNTGTGGHIMATMQGGKAIAIFGNGSNPSRLPTFRSVIANVINKLGWQKELVASKQPPNEKQLESITGRYLTPFEQVLTIQQKDQQLVYEGPLVMWSNNNSGQLIYVGDDKFAANEQPNQLDVQINPDDQHPYLTFYRQGSRMKEYMMRKLDKGENLPFEVAQTGSFEQTLQAYQQWQKQHPFSALHSANTLNRSGYQALQQQQYTQALNLLKVQAALYPDNANAFDSLGEALMKSGDKQQAIVAYRKSLQLNPDNGNAKQMLIELQH
ncbi:serine hydrolase [Neptunicella sp. SCSIO 80796]|uniref:serine hydrolase n=1 Tax=Neptunicella plasticusilytica TaxID=3117012 RepID=UPI003A4DB209